MAKFKKKTKTSQDIPTSSLPDIIFMLLFFFLLVATLRETDIKVKTRLPDASQIQELKRKSLVSHVYIGPPLKPEKYGKEPRILVNGVFIKPSGIPGFVEKERQTIPPAQRNDFTVSLKIDKEAKMGIVTDVKEKLRSADARKINYNTNQEGLQ